MKIKRPYPTDASRKRRWADPIRQRYYADYRARRFRDKMLGL